MATKQHTVLLLLVLCNILALTAGQQAASPTPVIATAPAETDCILRLSPDAAPFVITLNHKWVTDRDNYTIAFGLLANVLGHRSDNPKYATLDWPGINSFFCGWDPNDPTFIEEYHTFSNNQAWAAVGSSAALEYAGGVQAAIRYFDTWWLSPTDSYSIGLQTVVIQYLGPENHYYNQDGRNMTGFEMNNPVDYIGSPSAEPLPYCVNKTLRLTEAQRRKPIAIVLNATTVSKGDSAYRSSLEALTQLYRNIPCVISFVSWKQPGREWPTRSNSKHFGSMMFNSMECLRVALLSPSDQNLRQAVTTWLASVKDLVVTPFYFPTEPNIPATIAHGLKALRPGLRGYRRFTMRPREWHAGYIVNSVINLEWVNSSLSGLPIYEPLSAGTGEIYSLQG